MPSLFPWMVFVLGIGLSFVLWRDASRTQEEKARLAFELQVDKVVSGIEDRFSAHEQILRGVAGLFLASESVDRKEFHQYVKSLHLDLRYPGIQGIGYAPLFPRAQLDGHTARIRKEGFPTYRVHPEGERDQYSAITYLEPFNWRNQRAFGFDMYSEPVRRQAMEQARDTGRPALSGRVTLMQETDREVQPGTLLYVPLYQGEVGDSLMQRRAALRGWAYMPLRMQDMLDSVFENEFPELVDLIAFRVFDGDSPLSDHRLFESTQAAWDHPGGWNMQRRIIVAGRIWLVEAHALPRFFSEKAESRGGLLVLSTVAMTIMLTLFLELFGRYSRQLAEVNQVLVRGQNELQNIYDTSSAAIFLINRGGLIVHANRRMAEMLGCSLEAVIGSRYEDWVTPTERAAAQGILTSLFAGERNELDIERGFCRQDGTLFVGRVVGRTMPGADGLIEGVVGVITDVTQVRLHEAELRIAAIAFESSEAMVVTDTEGCAVRVNRAFTELTGYTQEEVIGRNMRLLSSGRHSPEFYRAIWEDILAKGFWQGEIWNRHKDGTVYPQWQTITAVRAADGTTTHYVGSAFDISQRVAQDNEMRNLAFYDHLTGLANRRLFGDRLQHAFAKCSRNRKFGAVIYIDLDHFKDLNDHLGHAEGDRLLEEVADRLTQGVREGDTVARLGGDEFVVLLEDLARERAAATEIAVEIAEGIRLLLNQPYHLHGEMPAGWQCTPSIGVALFCDQQTSAEDVISRADAALYAAKHAGRNQVRLDETPF